MPEEIGMNDAESPVPEPTVRRSGPVVPEKARWHGRLAARMIWLVVRAVALTVRWELDDRSGLIRGDGKQRVILAIWHNRLSVSLAMYQRYIAKPFPGRKLAALVSASRDGGLLARTLELFDTLPIRGSSSRRGSQALRELVAAAESGYDLAITPDGPRGPCYTLREGVVVASQLTGLPVVPVSYRLSAKWTLKSWDRFQIPKPFCLCQIVVGESAQVPGDADDALRESIRRDLEVRLRAITQDT
ncbi:MAG TPA: lysophospholipid acyltransferase family protein [Candidatus Limnocylindria bacterium]|nr:lysophospholipid acyltransferase family protein [Candidatus Limnocylindria bacterium]